MRQTVRAPAARTGWRNAVSYLENPQFRWLFASNTVFFFAMQGQMIIRSIIAFDLTQSALALGFINFAVAIPMMLVSPFGGVIADRVERRQLIIAGQAAVDEMLREGFAEEIGAAAYAPDAVTGTDVIRNWAAR